MLYYICMSKNGAVEVNRSQKSVIHFNILILQTTLKNAFKGEATIKLS